MRVYSSSAAVAALVVALVAPTAAHAETAEAVVAAKAITDDVALVPVVSGLEVPVDVTAPPGDDRLFVVERAGRIRIIENGALLATPFLDITGPVLSGGERGLLGLAFDPDYAANGRFYVNYTGDAGGGDSVVARYEVSANDPNRADAGSGVTLLTINQPYGNHNGGSIAIGPDGYLYAGFGDGGSANDPHNHGQNKGTLLGSIVRIDPETGAAAPDNPFVGKAGHDKIWAWGLRNPWRFSFDAANGAMYIGDVGQDTWEEVDRIPPGKGGRNFGWRIREGAHCRAGLPCDSTGLIDPIWEYAHAGAGCSGSITGGHVYRGNELPQLKGHYFFADYCRGFLRSFTWAGGRVTEFTRWDVVGPPGNVTSFGVDGYGELYLTAGSSVYRFTSTAPLRCDFDGDGDADLAVGSPGETPEGIAGAGTVHVFDGNSAGLDPADVVRLWQGRNGVGQTPEPGDEFGAVLACGNFNGDGYGDLAVGAPGEERVGRNEAGLVHVLFGGPRGLSGNGDQLWHQGRSGLATGSERRDRFGASLAAGDFDGDGLDDLAIGVPGESIKGIKRAGAVTVLYGTATGLTAAGNDFLHQDADEVKDQAEAFDRFGWSLTAADFDGDGIHDLAVGVPRETVDGRRAGMVHVFKGGHDGLTRRDSLWHRGRRGILGGLQPGAKFGAALAAGHFDADGFADLAVGIPGAGSAADAGNVAVLYGGPKGVSARDQRWRQGGAGLPGLAEASDVFGFALTVADFDGDGLDDLAVGAPGERRSGAAASGDVTVIYGSAPGLAADAADVWHRGLPNVVGSAVADDRFGTGLSGVDIDGDGADDLTVAARATALTERGDFQLLYGSGNGLTVAGNLLVNQDTPGVPSAANDGDRFGAGLP